MVGKAGNDTPQRRDPLVATAVTLRDGGRGSRAAITHAVVMCGLRRLRLIALGCIALACGLPAATPARAATAETPARAATAATPAAPSWGRAAIVERGGTEPVLERDGRPFFVYGAAFFYERLPRERWASSMRALRALGVNTLDLYVPWNWHEPADGDFDFDGRTNPRRDLDEVLRLARADDFAIILRPGPVIRNEWRNGGYPAWLLERPEYGMPLHDVLEGRYPATATLQNAHSDDAAAQWMRNATHVRYATRWLQRVLRECAPVADRIIAIALDDDQGAYIDNQTFPAPNLRRYLLALRDIVTGVTGPGELTFINTYQMKVPASSPVWTMGNWYQSDAFEIGEHDRAQLEFSTGLLHTRPHQPLIASEFQAGWLEGPDDVRPRPAAPSNTALALATMYGLGVRGVVNFPLQDTLAPAGWEAPFSNAFYAWDAALTIAGERAPRYAPTAAFGALVTAYGPALAAAQTRYDAAIAYLGASLPAEQLTNDRYGELAARTIAAQQACRAASLTCALVDPHALDVSALKRYPILVVPGLAGTPSALLPEVRATLDAYRNGGGALLEGVPPAQALRRALTASGRRPIVEGIPGASFAADTTGTLDGFLSIPNYDAHPLDVTGATVDVGEGRRVALGPIHVAAHDARIEPVGARVLSPPEAQPEPGASADPDASVPLRDDARLATAAFRAVSPGTALAYAADVYGDGSDAVVLDNGDVRLVVAPAAGARAFAFVDRHTGRSAFTAVGALRDDVEPELPPSASDRIARYTHQLPAGTFNRPYRAGGLAGGTLARATFAYDAPDIAPGGIRYERTVSLAPHARAFDLDEAVAFGAGVPAATRAVSVSSLAVGAGAAMTTQRVLAPDDAAFIADATTHVEHGHALGLYDDATHELATVAWRAGDVERADVLARKFSVLARLTLARVAVAHLRFGYVTVPSRAAAREALAAADAAAQSATAQAAAARRDVARAAATQGAISPARTLRLLGKWRNGLRDRLKSG